jgi:hypothetical protein
MASSDSKSKRSRPTCGVISLALPLVVGIAIYLVLRTLPEGDSGTLGTAVLAFYSLVAAIFASVLLAIVALVRREKWWMMPCITLGLDALAVLTLIKILI